MELNEKKADVNRGSLRFSFKLFFFFNGEQIGNVIKKKKGEKKIPAKIVTLFI